LGVGIAVRLIGIADRRAVVGLVPGGCAREAIRDAVAVRILGAERRRIARVADAIAIGVALIGVGEQRTVVVAADPAVAVGVAVVVPLAGVVELAPPALAGLASLREPGVARLQPAGDALVRDVTADGVVFAGPRY